MDISSVSSSIEITILSCLLSNAKKKLQEDAEYEFRVKLVLKNDTNEVIDSKNSKKVKMIEDTMEFKDSQIIFNNIDISKGLIEIFPLFKSPQSEKVRKYNSTTIYINQLIKNHSNQLKTIILDYPENSSLKIKYTLTTSEPSNYITTISKPEGNKNNIPNSSNLIQTTLNTIKGYELKKINKDINKSSKEIEPVNDPNTSKFKNILNIYEKQTSQPIKTKIQRKSSNNLTKISLEKNINKDEPKILAQAKDPSEKCTLFINDTTLKIDNNRNKLKENITEIRSNQTNNTNNEVFLKYPSSTIHTNKVLNPDKYIEGTCVNKEIDKKLDSTKYQDKNLERNSNISSDNSNETSFNTANKSVNFNNKSNSFLIVDDNPRNNSMNNKSDLNFVEKNLLRTQNKSKDNYNKTITSSNDLKVNDYTIIEYKEEKFIEEEYPPDSFCEAFFGVSLPISNPKLINESDKFIPPCKHENCGMLPAYKPEIVFRVPFQDNKKFDLNSIIASLCFPKGIKLCFSEDEKTLETIKNFLIINTNAFGVRYYIMTYHYYEKINLTEFHNKYEMNPVREFLNLERETDEMRLYENNPEIQRQLEINLQKKLEMCSAFLFNENIFIPKCICLLSKYPYSSQMEKCLDSILKMSCNNSFNNSDINKLILFFIKEIPIPPSNKKIQFNIPFQIDPIEISGPQYKNLPILTFHLKILFDQFSIENIILIHHLILCEQKILFICDNLNCLTEVLESFIALLYPLQWTYPYIPILSEELVKYLQTPLPFVMGIDNHMIDLIKEYLNEDDDVFLVYLNSKDKDNNIDKFTIKKTKINRKKLCQNLPSFPEEINKDLTNSLKEIKKIIDKKHSYLNLHKIDKSIREAFAMSMVKMFGDFMKYVSFLDNVPLFNKDSFFSTKSLKEKDFYDKLVESQNFNFFLQQDSKESFPYFYDLCLKETVSFQNDINKYRPTTSSFTQQDKKNLSVSAIYTGTDIKKSSFVEEIDEDDKDLFYEKRSLDYLETYRIENNYFKNNKFTFKKIPNVKILMNGEINFDLPNPFAKTFNRYIIPDQEKDSLLFIPTKSKLSETPVNDNIEMINSARYEDSRRITIINRSRGVHISGTNDKKQKEDMENLISDYLRQIFTSNTLTDTERKNILGIMKFREARTYLSKLIFQSKFKEEKTICLGEKGFTDLSNIIFFALLEINDKYDYEDGRLLTKSSFYYYKTYNGKDKTFLYFEIIKRNGKFNAWQNHNFWLKWFELETKEILSTTNDINDHYMNILISMMKLMYELKIDVKFVFNSIIDTIAKKKFISNNSQNLIKELEKILKRQFNLNNV